MHSSTLNIYPGENNIITCMYTFMYMQSRKVCICTCSHVHVHDHMCMYIQWYIKSRTCMYMYTCRQVYMYTCIHVGRYTCTCRHVHVHAQSCTCTCAHVIMYMYTCIGGTCTRVQVVYVHWCNIDGNLMIIDYSGWCV